MFAVCMQFAIVIMSEWLAHSCIYSLHTESGLYLFTVNLFFSFTHSEFFLSYHRNCPLSGSFSHTVCLSGLFSSLSEFVILSETESLLSQA